MQTLNSQKADLPAFEGRVTIIGTVISIKFVENQFGGCLKMLVEHETGWRIWGTVPAAISFINETIKYSNRTQPSWSQRGLLRGDVVRFDAKVEKSDKDSTFGFFSRATKPALLAVVDGRVDGLKDGYPHIIRTVLAD